jgi:uncharacterized membrane protein (Fun14 family)
MNKLLRIVLMVSLVTPAAFAEDQKGITIQIDSVNSKKLERLIEDYDQVVDNLPKTLLSKMTSYVSDHTAFGSSITVLSKDLMETFETRKTDQEFNELLFALSHMTSERHKLSSSDAKRINNALAEELREQNQGYFTAFLKNGASLAAGAVAGAFITCMIGDKLESMKVISRANLDIVPVVMMGSIVGAISGYAAQDFFDILESDPFRIRIGEPANSTQELLDLPMSSN